MILIIFNVVFVIAMFFAWAIGGEYRFGKGKRGFLLAIPMTILGFWYISLLWLAVQVAILYVIYQVLFYDEGISFVYEKKNPKGWLIIGLNGAMIGLTPTIFLMAGGHVARILLSAVISALFFCFVVRISNDDRFKSYRAWLTANGPQYIPYIDDQGHKGYYINFKDSWWVSEGLMGLVLGILIITLR